MTVAQFLYAYYRVPMLAVGATVVLDHTLRRQLQLDSLDDVAKVLNFLPARNRRVRLDPTRHVNAAVHVGG